MKHNNVNVSSSSSSGIGFVGLLTIVFIVLKLLGKITWSWWWVLSPLWISTGLVILILLGVFLGVIISVNHEEKKAYKKQQKKIFFTEERPIGFGRNGDLVANTPILFFPPSLGGFTVADQFSFSLLENFQISQI